MYNRLFIEFIISAAGAFLLTVLLSHYVIPVLRGRKIGQSIREEGPSWHKSKEGTPTMGGICFIMAMLFVAAGFTIYYALHKRQSELIPLALTLGLAVFNGLLGFIDDYCKLLKKENEGLTVIQKLVLEFVVAIAYVAALAFTGYLDTVLHIPFTGIELELGWLYYVFAVLLIVGMVNAVNFTDGLDGLASTVTLVVAGFFAFAAFSFLNSSLALTSGVLLGGMVGFLIYNFHPAKVFMGDTGSLFLGGLVTGMAFLINEPLIIVIAGGIYVFELFSVIIQVGCYKLFKKRVFKMAPVHHHFEKCGWGEVKVVTVFGLITVALSVAAWFAI